MISTALIASLAATSMAWPTFMKREPSTLTPAPLSERFSVTFTVDGVTMAAQAVLNSTEETSNQWLLQAMPLCETPGTPAYLNRSNPNPDPNFNYTALNFILPNDAVYGAFAADVGDNYGLAVDIDLVKNAQQFQWLENDGQIGHKLFAAPNGLYACNGTLYTGEAATFLAFGDYNFSGPVTGYPNGCGFTKVYQNFNIDGGATADDE